MENKKPRICEILGVEVGQRFNLVANSSMNPYRITTEGYVVDRKNFHIGSANEAQALQDAINGKIKIEIVDEFTEGEKEIMRHMQAVGYRYMIRDYGVAFFTENKPKKVGTAWTELGPCASLPEIYNGLFKAITQESEPVSIEEALA